MFPNAKSPSVGRSVIRFDMLSLTMTLEMNDELLFVTLFLGFFLLLISLAATAVRRELPSPKAGADPTGIWMSLAEVPLPSSLLTAPSADCRPSLEAALVLEAAAPKDSPAAGGPL